MKNYRTAFILLLTALVLSWPGPFDALASELRPFTSDGCSLFPDGTIRDRTKWCECCLNHDLSYWQGGTADERKKADEALRDCVLKRTRDKNLAETMYLGVRTGGHPAVPAWYRWGYGWPYGRGYRPLSEAETQRVRERIDEYRQKHPKGYCGERSAGASPDTARQRPATWATPVPSKHLRNFYRIDEKLYRSAQPKKKGFRELKALGIRNVLSLRDYHSDDDGEGLGLNLYRVRMSAGNITTEQVVEALRIIRSSEGPILIHCWHGSDRTGLVSALYRLVFQGWSKEEAIDELMHGGYGYHSLYRNIPEFIRRADIDEIRKQVDFDAKPRGRDENLEKISSMLSSRLPSLPFTTLSEPDEGDRKSYSAFFRNGIRAYTGPMVGMLVTTFRNSRE